MYVAGYRVSSFFLTNKEVKHDKQRCHLAVEGRHGTIMTINKSIAVFVSEPWVGLQSAVFEAIAV